MALNENVRREADISHALQMLVELNRNFTHIAEPGHSIAEIVESIRDTTLTGDNLATFNRIDELLKEEKRRASAEGRNSVFDEIQFRSHSFADINFIAQEGFVAAGFFDRVNENGELDVYFTARGTGDGRWLDNGRLMTELQTQMQRETLRYFEEVMGRTYGGGLAITGSLNLAGHSKGANDVEHIGMFSQYRDLIHRVFAFSGPNHSDTAFRAFEGQLRAEAANLLSEEASMHGRQGRDPDGYIHEFRSRFYAFVGENDYTPDRGRNQIALDGNVFNIRTCSATDAKGVHIVHNLSGLCSSWRRLDRGETIQVVGCGVCGPGLNFFRDRNGAIIQGEPGAVRRLSLFLNDLERKMPDHIYHATSMSIMAILEGTLGGKRGIGDVKFVTEEEWQLFVTEGLPFIINGPGGDGGGLRRNPQMVFEALQALGITFVGPELLDEGLIRLVLHILGNADDNAHQMIIQELEPIIFYENGIDFSNVNFFLLLGEILLLHRTTRDLRAAAHERGAVSRTGNVAMAGGNTIDVDLNRLKKIKANAQRMIDVMNRELRVVGDARAAANEAMTRYSEDYVHRDARAVLETCRNIEYATRNACRDFQLIVDGLDASIREYANLEMSLSRSEAQRFLQDRIQFNFSAAQNIMDILRECEQAVDAFSSSLCNEVKMAGQWWKGESYESFKEAYTVSGNRLQGLDGFYHARDKAAMALHASNEKRGLEDKLAAKFRR